MACFVLRFALWFVLDFINYDDEGFEFCIMICAGLDHCLSLYFSSTMMTKVLSEAIDPQEKHRWREYHALLNETKKYLFTNIWASSWENVSSGVSDQVRLKLACSATEASMRLEILVTYTRDITLSRQRTTKALIRLFSHGPAHMMSHDPKP